MLNKAFQIKNKKAYYILFKFAYGNSIDLNKNNYITYTPNNRILQFYHNYVRGAKRILYESSYPLAPLSNKLRCHLLVPSYYCYFSLNLL